MEKRLLIPPCDVQDPALELETIECRECECFHECPCDCDMGWCDNFGAFTDNNDYCYVSYGRG